MKLTLKQPARKAGTSPAGPDFPVFIIQRHLNGDPCYDFWLEIDGAFRLWHVQAGAFQEQRGLDGLGPLPGLQLAPFSWEDLRLRDGTRVSPQVIWDAGEYRLIGDGNGSLQSSLEAGEVNIWLQGERLRGRFKLLRAGDDHGESVWLLERSASPEPSP